MLGATLNFLNNGKKIKFPLFLFPILLIQILSVSCTIWPVVTALAAPQSGSSNDNSSLVLLALLQNGNTTGSSPSSNTGGGTSGGGTSSPCFAGGTCAVYLNIASSAGGNLGGVSGADARCVAGASGAGAPGDPNSYKALLMAEDGLRNLTTDWVLYPNTVYKSVTNGNLTITSTNAGAQFIFPVTNTVGAANATYTGIDASGATWVPKTAGTCTNAGVSWSTNSGAFTGWAGFSNGNLTNTVLLVDGGSPGYNCSNNLGLYCVQR
ncbi:DUF1554 domain-containing protein [Leptospira yasudae]|uniref:DUF1554 domain-containing protein n=1 Tax=Leptospira yasudae TaxID=2202201 RepID=A0A6N4QHQ8_9LEPT|nr:DUF1554 domain-containing protein [Leptospira yasudae]TGL78147.1 DUF1554 domain-containing protein [Leptospira yasudae]TGL80689.1 DUF1554 domain-containing protein [Leptospira yasudae]TGL85230.1 DUF1554 domain-containing protein [Leptospira yasudae]